MYELVAHRSHAIDDPGLDVQRLVRDTRGTRWDQVARRAREVIPLPALWARLDRFARLFHPLARFVPVALALLHLLEFAVYPFLPLFQLGLLLFRACLEF